MTAGGRPGPGPSYWRTGWRFWPERLRPVDADYVQRAWIRPYRPGPTRVAFVVGMLAVLGLPVMVAVLTAGGEPSWPARAGHLLLGIWLVAVLAWGLGRAFAAGVYVNDFGVKVVRFWRTREARWESVGAVEDRPGRVGLLGVPLLPVSGRRVWLVLDGRQVATPLTSRGPDFLGRPEAYDMASGAVARWWAEAGSRGQPG